MTNLIGLPLRYLIGYDGNPPGEDGTITEVPGDCDALPRHGIGVGYCNLRCENGEPKRFRPYLPHDDIYRQYGEGRPDPHGPGFDLNLIPQLDRRKVSGFQYIEQDNPDSYSITAVLHAIDLAATRGLKVIAKNPGLVSLGMNSYIKHPNVYGIIVERGAGTPDSMDALRKANGRPTLPVWFVGYVLDGGTSWTKKIAPRASLLGMGVTNSTKGEYGNAVDVVKPHQPGEKP